MLNDGVILLNEPRPWKVRGAIAWSSDLTLHSATLEARLDALESGGVDRIDSRARDYLWIMSRTPELTAPWGEVQPCHYCWRA